MKTNSFDEMMAERKKATDAAKAKAEKAYNLKNSLADTKDKMFYGLESLLKNNPITNFLSGKGLAILDEDTYAIYLKIVKDNAVKGTTSHYTYTIYKMDKKTNIIVDTYNKKIGDNTFDWWDITELQRFLQAEKVSYDEVEKLLYLGLTTKGVNELGSEFGFEVTVSNEASTGINTNPKSVIINGGISSENIPDTQTGVVGLASFDDATSALKDRCKYIIDEIMNLNKFRQDLDYVIDKSYDKFEAEEVSIHEWEVTEIVESQTPNGTIQESKKVLKPRYTVIINRTVKVNEVNGFPIPIMCNVVMSKSLDADGNLIYNGFKDADAQGNIIELNAGFDYLQFLLTRFGNSLSPQTIIQTIDEAESNVNGGGLLGLASSILKAGGSSLISDFTSNKVDEYEAKVVASTATKLDSYKVNEVSKGFLASDKFKDVLSKSSSGGKINDVNQVLKYYEVEKKGKNSNDTSSTDIRVISDKYVLLASNQYKDYIFGLYSISNIPFIITSEFISNKKFETPELEAKYNEYIDKGMTVPVESNMYTENGKTTYKIIKLENKVETEMMPQIISSKLTVSQFSKDAIICLSDSSIFLMYYDRYYTIKNDTNLDIVEIRYLYSDLMYNVCMLKVKVVDGTFEYILARFLFNTNAKIELYPDIFNSVHRFNIFPFVIDIEQALQVTLDKIKSDKFQFIKINQDMIIIVKNTDVEFKVYKCELSKFIDMNTRFIDLIETTDYNNLTDIFNCDTIVDICDGSGSVGYTKNKYIMMVNSSKKGTFDVTPNTIMNVDVFGNIYAYSQDSYKDGAFNRVGDIFLVGDRVDSNANAKYIFGIDNSSSKSSDLVGGSNFQSDNKNINTPFGDIINSSENINTESIVSDKIATTAKSTKIRLDVSINSIVSSAEEKTMGIDYITVKKASKIKAGIESHRDMIIDIYKKLLAMETKANGLPDEINPYLITQYAKLK